MVTNLIRLSLSDEPFWKQDRFGEVALVPGGT
jgi:hypothetical protein